MKTLLTVFLTLCASAAFAQSSTTYCQPMGMMTNCSTIGGGNTTIMPLGNGMSTWSNSQGQSGTIMTPSMPLNAPQAPLPPMAPAPYSQPQPLGRSCLPSQPWCR